MTLICQKIRLYLPHTVYLRKNQQLLMFHKIVVLFINNGTGKQQILLFE
jgi:hypothetical protein